LVHCCNYEKIRLGLVEVGKICIDLDNTIAIYDDVIVQICKDLNIYLPPEIKRKKGAIANYLRAEGRNDLWTKIQGLCYGPYMHKAKVAKNFRKFVSLLVNSNYDLVLVSHKTKTPASGEKFNLHEAAENWIDKNLKNVFKEIFFEMSFKKKIQRINSLNPEFVIDDLPEVLAKIDLEISRKILIFSNHLDKEYSSCKDWSSLTKFIIGDTHAEN